MGVTGQQRERDYHERGLCVSSCGRRCAPNRVRCNLCLTKERLWKRAAQGYAGNKRCGLCKKLGHDQRTCPRRGRDLLSEIVRE